METLKQQLVMVGVQQLALTGVPTGAALLNGRRSDTGGGPVHPFNDSAAAAATLLPLSAIMASFP
ncbi:unnamed protein product, partial [Ectocarpus fasciculatus]